MTSSQGAGAAAGAVVRRTVVIENERGLHPRAGAKFVLWWNQQEKAAGDRNGASLRILSTGNFTRCAGRCCNEPAAGAW